jgi:hypothetical protein
MIDIHIKYRQHERPEFGNPARRGAPKRSELRYGLRPGDLENIGMASPYETSIMTLDVHVRSEELLSPRMPPPPPLERLLNLRNGHLKTFLIHHRITALSPKHYAVISRALEA